MSSSATTTTIVEARAIKRDFKMGDNVVHVLRGIDLDIAAGEFVALRGRSGSGKTTLLNILTGLDNPSSGSIFILERDLSLMAENERARLRREHIGILFQNAHLFPSLTAQENIEIPLRLARTSSSRRTTLVRDALDQVGLLQRARHRSMELSGGEQQRVALARALVHKPRFIVADEPTGNLDSLTGQDIIKLLREITHRENVGMLIATHDPLLISSADRVIQIQDGQLLV
jgi:ABC-type lipoprotein export system ATPase subunit